MSDFSIGTNLAASSALIVDTTAPTITSVTSTTADGSYNAGDAIHVTVTFSEAVTLAGGNLVITLETGSTDRTVTISGISSGTTATGTYSVLAGDTSADLTVTIIALSAGTLSDAAGNTMSNFTPGTNLAGGSALVVDTTAPTITSVTSITADGSYTTGDTVNVTVTFSEVATLAGGNLVITLETGATDRTVTISAINNATTATATYTVQAGDTSADLTVNTIALSAGTLSDAAGNSVSDFSIGTNLAANSAIVVVTTETLTSTSLEPARTAPADEAHDLTAPAVDDYDLAYASEPTTWTDDTAADPARAEDETFNTFALSPIRFTHDATAPGVTVSSPNDAEYWAGGSAHDITWSVADTDIADSPVTISYYNGSRWVDIATGEANDGSYTWTVPNMNIARAKVRVTTADKTAKSKFYESDVFTIDSVTPRATIHSLLTNDSTPELTGTVDDPKATIEVTVNGISYQATNNGDGTWSLADNTIDADLPPGTYDVIVTVTDLAGNVSTEEAVAALKITIEVIPGALRKTNAGVAFVVSSILLCHVTGASVMQRSVSPLRRRRAMRSKDCH